MENIKKKRQPVGLILSVLPLVYLIAGIFLNLGFGLPSLVHGIIWGVGGLMFVAGVAMLVWKK